MALVATESTDLPYLEVMNLLIMLSTLLLSHVHASSQPKYPEGSSQQKLDQQHEAAQGAGQDVGEEEVEDILVS
jgi:hypothetical protein